MSKRGFTQLLFSLAAVAIFGSLPALATTQVTTIQPVGKGVVQVNGMGSPATAGNPEIDPALAGDDTDAASGGGVIDRSIVNAPGTTGPQTSSGKKAKSNPELNLSVDGLNFFQQRFANNGNQFSVEPPDQGLCAGNGYVIESANDVLDIFDSGGNLLTGPVDLNTFYGYPAAIVRSTFTIGPEITDPSCVYDPDTQRFYHVVLTLDRVNNHTTALNLQNHIDLAVSDTSNPLGSWTVYSFYVTDDGSNGTPAHANCPCLGDYPHIGFDSHGIYITTNEFPWPGGYNSSQIYAMSKRQLAAGGPVTLVRMDTNDIPFQIFAGVYIPGFTVWPAQSPAGDFATQNNGTEYLMASLAVWDGFDNRIAIYSLSNTASLDSPTPNLSAGVNAVRTEAYGIPPRVNQEAGDIPLAEATDLGIFGTNPFAPTLEVKFDGNDSRMQQVTYTNGKLWGALDTGLVFTEDPSTIKVGIAYFVINPGAHGAGALVKGGYLGLLHNNLTRPGLSVTASGRGVLGFTVAGDDNYPGTGYVGIDALLGAGDLHIMSNGVGPDDGFSGYKFWTYPNPPRPRWGDYGAAATDGNSVWLGNEYINQTCDLSTYLGTSFRCDNTRGELGNWGTRISKVTP
jgi:hypothetical protein